MSIEPTSSPERPDGKTGLDVDDTPDKPNPDRGFDLALVLLTVVVSGLGSMLTADGLSATATVILVAALAVIAVVALWTVCVGRR
jgi:hypothetical protein